MSKKMIAIIILSLEVIGFAKQHSNEPTVAPAYQNQVDQEVKAFKVNGSSKI